MVLEIVQTSPMGGKPVILFPQKYFTAYAIGIGPFASQRLWLWLRTLFQSCTVSLLYFTRTWSMQSFRVDQSCVKCLRKCECNVSFRSFHCLVLNLMQFSCEVRDWATRPKVWSRRKLLPVLQRGDQTLQGINEIQMSIFPTQGKCSRRWGPDQCLAWHPSALPGRSHK